MKKFWIIALIFAVICGSTFANTKIFSLGGDIKYHFKQEEVSAFDIFTGVTRFFDKDDIKTKLVPIFDAQAGFTFSSSGIGIYTQLTGGISVRPIELLILNINAGARVTGLWNGDFSYIIFPDVFDFDGVIDTSFTLNFLYMFGVKLGNTFFFGTTGVGGIPYIAFTSSLK
jgi:hypothetical protein